MINNDSVLFLLLKSLFLLKRCLRTIAQYDGSSEHLCYSQTLTEKLKEMKIKWPKSRDIIEEAKLLWYMIHRNKKPNRPQVDGNSCSTESILFLNEKIITRLWNYYSENLMGNDFV